jgi:hypothetical protein
MWAEAMRSTVERWKVGMSLKYEVGLAREPEAGVLEVREHGLGAWLGFRCLRIRVRRNVPLRSWRVLGLLRANRNTSDAYTQAEHNQETVYVRAALAKKTHPFGRH